MAWRGAFMGRHEDLFIFAEIQTMINAGFVDFLFTGAAIVPEVLMIAGYVGEGLLLLVPMLIAACLISVYHEHAGEQQASAAPDAAALEMDGAAAESEPRQA